MENPQIRPGICRRIQSARIKRLEAAAVSEMGQPQFLLKGKGQLMENIIPFLILMVILGLAVFYIVPAKKKGVKCIGCPAGGNCPSSFKIKNKKLEGPVIGKKVL